MKNNKNNKIVSILYFTSALCFYVCAIINFTGKDSGMGTMYICLGSTFLCLGIVWLNKGSNGKDDDDKSSK